MGKSKITMADNKAFRAASAPDKRRLIAKDVIMQLRLKNYFADSLYVQDRGNNECTVCGIGSCLVSAERLDNPDKSIEDIASSENWGKLKRYFGENQLAIIEEFFENSCDDHENEGYYIDLGGMYNIRVSETTNDIVNNAKGYFCGLTPTQRLQRIMENIIRNGKFDFKEEIEFRTNPQPKVDVNIDRLREMIKGFVDEEIAAKEKELKITN